MRRDHFLPTYEQLFGELDFRAVDEARSVYSPAAYLVDLLQLIDDNFDGAPLTGQDRRSDLVRIPLDTEATYTEIPYLDVVNRVLATLIGPDAQRLHELTESYAMPFDFDRFKVRRYLHHLGVDPVLLHGLFDDHPDRDAIVREQLGLSASEAELLTTVVADQAGQQDVEGFRRATRITEAELDDLLRLDPAISREAGKLVWGDGKKPVPAAWFDRAGRFVRLSRRIGLTLDDADLVLRRCCANTLDTTALRILAAVLRIHRDLDLPIAVVVNLVSPLELPVPDRKQFPELTGLSEAGIAAVVRRVQQRYPGTVARSGPFDRFGLDALSLLYRAGQLTTALGITVDELFGLLDALGKDATVLRTTAFGAREVDPATQDLYGLLEAPDVESALCLVRLLTGVVGWLRALGMDVSEFGVVLGAVEGDWADLQLDESLDAVAFTPELFSSPRFSDRAAQVVHDVLVRSGSAVSPRDERLLRLDPATIATAAFDALNDLAVITDADFRGLGLAERLATKIRTNLVLAGHVDAEGLLVPGSLPARAEDFVLAHDFSDVEEPVLALMAESEAIYPSDLMRFEHADELYDNLLALGHIDSDGTIISVPSTVTVSLNDVAPAVFEQLQVLAEQARTAQVALDPAIFAELPISSGDLLDSLRFNGYVDSDDNYTDIAALSAITTRELSVDISFHPYRAAILQAMQAQLATTRAAPLTVDDETFAEIADASAARTMAEALDGTYLVDERVPEAMRAFFADATNVVSVDGLFTDADLATVTGRIAAVLAERKPYRFDLDAVAELGFDAEETRNLVGLLIARGDLDDDLVVPQERLGHSEPAAFSLPGLEDYATDVFYLLHVLSRELTAGIAEIVEAVTELAERQRTLLVAALADTLGLPIDVTEAICAGVAGSVAEALDGLLGGSVRAHDRIRRFALLATRLGLDAAGVTVAFHDQDLAGGFSEPLLLPEGVHRVDALLEGDGVHLFHGRTYWFYPPGSETAVGPRPLTDLSPRFAGLTSVDAAFVDGAGTAWIVGGAKTFVRTAGATHWDQRDQVWGEVHSTFAAPQRIDSAFVDDEGRTYLFRGDQYVRYSGPDYEFADEGYPRDIGEWWEGEGHQVPLPGRFRSTVDASFQDRDGVTHLFSGDHTLALGNGGTERPTAEVWGRVRNVLAGTGRIDAAYTDGAATVLFSGGQVVSYTDCVENDGVTVDEGYPLSVTTYLPKVPVGFDGTIDAALRDDKGAVHLFRDGRSVEVGRTPGATADRWGKLGPVLTDGVVDSAFVGRDGMTYLFSGDRYLRYSGADYSVVDHGYPRQITGDWGGLTKVGASFVLDGATHLFGTGGLVFTLGTEHVADVEAGAVSRALRERLREHGITVAADARLAAVPPPADTPAAAALAWVTTVWRLTAENRISLTLRRAGALVEVYADPGPQYHVRYSTNSYSTPDAGYPRPLADNWWNLPETGFDTVDAVFTGRDGRTFLFSGPKFVVFDARRRWWSEPRDLQQQWEGLPFERVDAAFVGKDGRTYLFDGPNYVRYSGGDHSRLDDRYPAPTSSLWGNVVNNIARHGRIDAALKAGDATYLFSGNQYVRHDGTRIADGYPRALDSLKREPGFANLPALTGPVEAAFADRRTTYLVVDGQCHAVSKALHGRYDTVAVRSAFMENGSVVAETADGWQRISSLEGTTVTRTSVRPRTLRTVPAKFRDGLDSVLRGTDGNTYLFKGTSCYDVALKREYPLAEDWGRGRNTIADDNRIDTAFVGKDGRTYVFSGDQYVVYAGERLDRIDGEPRLIEDGWAGLTSVGLAYVTNGTTYVFERPAEDGSLRYLTFSGTDYDKPDDVPQTTDASFWGIPDGVAAPDAVLVEGDTHILVVGESYLTRREGAWTAPRPVSRLWPGTLPGPLNAAFTGRDGGTYLFSGSRFTRVQDGAVAPYREVREAWGRSRNNFADSGKVDAAFVDGDGSTFLFSGDQYARYSGEGYRHTDPGYPRPIADNLRTERAFANLPETFEDVVADRIEAGVPVLDAVVANSRTAYLFVGESLHVVSRTATATVDLKANVRNLVAETGKVDAALVTDGKTLLFSGDQYVRYSGHDTTFVDEGYPRTIEAEFAKELGVRRLPAELYDGVDAAFRGTDGTKYLFAGQYWFRSDGYSAQPIAENWGKVRNEFAGRPGLDSAFVAPSGELYVFRGRQYARYSGHDRTFVDTGFPRTIDNDWGDLLFEQGIDAAFVLNGRTYLARGEEYVRYSGRGYRTIDRGHPRSFRQRWSGGADYRFDDVHTIARFAGLARKHTGLAELVAGQRAFEDPYATLAALFGWDVDELRWLVRRRGLLTTGPRDDRVELELLHRLVDVFAVAKAFGTGPSAVHEIWTGLRGGTSVSARVFDLLAHRFSPQDWKALERQVHDELAVALRDALLALALTRTGAGTSRELFERLLIDVDMGARGMTSQVREAIAATQLFLHRYFLDLEELTERKPGTKAELRARWAWMRNYRTWEANRKVFLYPENYLRPELRESKTPAFEALEADLLQGEITQEAVEKAYKRYLDEYTEVSRLAIAGGHVFAPDSGNGRDLVLFGRTRTQPRRYYYRRARFSGADKLTAAWDAWLKVDVQIDADEVHPVHAFNRVFVFWTTKETVTAATTTTTLTTKEDGKKQEVTAPPQTERVRIHYSFYNLNREWVPAQTLAMDTRRDGSIFDIRLAVEATGESIVVSCTYSALTPGLAKSTFTQSAALSPELVEVPLTAITSGSGVVATDPMLDVLAATEFTQGVERPKVVRFTSTKGTDYGPWFSIDHKGGSFLCRPSVVAAGDPVEPKPLTDLGLPSAWTRVDSAVTVSGKQFFFSSPVSGFVEVTNGKAAGVRPITERWGRRQTNLTRTGAVDAVIRRGDQTFLFSGPEYTLYTGGLFGTPHPNYPKTIAANVDGFPKWETITAAFTDLNGVEWFYSAELDKVERRDGKAAPGGVFGRHPRFDAAIVDVEERQTFLIHGDDYVRYTGDTHERADPGYPRRLTDNPDDLPQRRIGAALRVQNTSYYFDDTARTCTEVVVERRRPRKSAETTRPSRELNRGATIGGTSTVDAAWVQDGYLYLTGDLHYYRYTLVNGTVPDAVDEGYPKPLQQEIRAVFSRGAQRYAFSGDFYARLGAHPGDLGAFAAVDGNWGDLPEQFDGVMDSDHLYFFDGATYLRHPKTGTVPRPFERIAMPIEIVRLTTSTAAQLNQRLLAGGVAALLDPASQELDERPAFRTDRSERNTIQVSGRVAATRLPASAHLDFQSANGVYYWEIFCHAPVLIAQALNSAQRFADARQWYEYVFDPTETDRYWRFLPFLAVDLAALADRCHRDMEALTATLTAAGFNEPAGLAGELAKVLADLAVLAPAFRENRTLTTGEILVLDRVSSSQLHLVLADAVVAAQQQIKPRTREPKKSQLLGVVRALEQLQERTALVAELRRQYDLVGDKDAQIDAYRRDPFDPHTIADLRPVAHRRSVVMAYVDNLLDWGDLLFQQYTMESIDEARMLYVFAWDLLGPRPERPGVTPLLETRTYSSLTGASPSSAVAELTGGGALLEGPGQVHAALANGYFRIPDNSLFTEYWDRVEDRLRKIRASLDFLGIARPLPLFEPPIDPMDLVRAVAGGSSVDAAVASGGAVAVPHQRFEPTFRRAQDLLDRLRQFGNDLLSVLDRRDSEELSLLQNRQESVILELTGAIKDAQVKAAEANLRELQSGRDATDQRIRHYQRLVDTGLSALEEAQIGLMGTASALHLTAALTKIGSAIAYGWPQQKIGPFIMGVEWGGKQVGSVLDKASEMTQLLGEGFSITGELLGVRAQQERTDEEWRFQLDTARADLVQINHQIAAAEHQLVSVRREADIHVQEVKHQKEIGTFLKDKFTGAQLYGWMAGRLAGLYFQTYGMAYETARAAERAYQFERGVTGTFIKPLYWESRRGGLLAGESLGVDLELLGQAFTSSDARSLEITRRVSLLELDSLALLRLADTGSCEFALTEDLFDRDFPGHFRRQIRTVSVAFAGADGSVQPNAVLTQLNHKTALEPDAKAVRHLLDPVQPPPASLRSDWRAGQRIALSQVGEQENNGLFELRYDDARYLPFEGTGAVSSWRLELVGRRALSLRDVVITVRYTADDGGEILANAVRGMLKPFATARFFDVEADFPEQWQEFVDGEGGELSLPFTPDMFPGLTGPITGVHPRYTNDSARLTLAATDRRVHEDGSGWTFVVDGDKDSLTAVGLVLTYRATLG